MNVPSLQPRVAADQLSLEQLEKNPALSQKEKIDEASKQFEAVLLRQILAQIRRPVFQSSLSSHGAASGIYQDMINFQMAETISKSGTLGLARSLESQLETQVLQSNRHADKSGAKDSSSTTSTSRHGAHPSALAQPATRTGSATATSVLGRPPAASTPLATTPLAAAPAADHHSSTLPSVPANTASHLPSRQESRDQTESSKHHGAAARHLAHVSDAWSHRSPQ